MKATQLIELLARRVRQHGDGEVFVGILMYDSADGECAATRIHRFSPTEVKFVEEGSDDLDHDNGPAIEIPIHQNESLWSWE